MTTDPRTAYALPARMPGASSHQQGRPAPWASEAVPDHNYTGLASQVLTVLYVPDRARARDRARVLAQLAEGSRRIAEHRANRGRP